MGAASGAAAPRPARGWIKSQSPIRLHPVLPSADTLLTSTRLRLLDAGYPPVPANGKNPGIDGYTAYANTPPSEDAIARWTTVRPRHRNTGIVCGRTRVIDLDVDDPELAAQCRGIIAEELDEYHSPPCRIGRWPRVMFFARSDDPDRRTKRFNFPNGSIEFLGHRAHAVVDGIHPDTGKPYYWWDEALWEVEADRLPILTTEHEAKILAKIAPVLGERQSSVASPSTRSTAYAGTGKVPIGWRNTELFPKVRVAGFSCATQDDLSARATAMNTSLCTVPLDRKEIDGMVRWVWDRKMKGELWHSGGEARAVVTRSEWAALDQDATYLLLGLRQAHDAQPGKLFAVASTAMAKSFKMCARRITRARNNLICSRFLERVGPSGRKGHPAQYRFSQKTLPTEHDTISVDPP